MYNKSATELEVNIVIGSPSKYSGAISSNGRVKIAWSESAFYINGSSIVTIKDSDFPKLNATCQYGAAQGNVMSTSHYNTIGIINSTKTAEELAQLTAI